MQETTNQTVLSAITNIKVPGVATMAYWSIVETSDSIYFVQSGSALGLGVGGSGLLTAISVVGDMVASYKAKQVATQDLNTILSGSERHFGFSKETLTSIKTQKGWFGGKIFFPNGKQKSWAESGTIRLKLSGKKFALFNEMLQRKLVNQ